MVRRMFLLVGMVLALTLVSRGAPATRPATPPATRPTTQPTTRPYEAFVRDGRLVVAALLVDGGGSATLTAGGSTDAGGTWVSRDCEVLTISSYPGDGTGSVYVQTDGRTTYLTHYRAYSAVATGRLVEIKLIQEPGGVWGVVVLRTPPAEPDLPLPIQGADLYDLADRQPWAGPLLAEALAALGTALPARTDPWSLPADYRPDPATADAVEALLPRLNADDWRERVRATAELEATGAEGARYLAWRGTWKLSPSQAQWAAEAFGPLPRD